MAIRDWPSEERPREKLLDKGAAALSDAELLAILLRTGIAGRSALDLAREILLSFRSLRKLIAADRARFCAQPGLGPARYAELQAAAEISRRQLAEPLRTGPSLASPRATRDFLSAKLRDLEHEVFCCLYLDKRHRLIQFEELFRGTIDGASVHPREIVKLALQRNCRRRDRRSQPPVGHCRAEPGGRAHHPAGQGGARAGGHPAARSHHRRRRRQRVAGGAGIALTADAGGSRSIHRWGARFIVNLYNDLAGPAHIDSAAPGGLPVDRPDEPAGCPDVAHLV